MLVLRNGKRIIKTYPSAYEFAEDMETINACFPVPHHAKAVRQMVLQNAFGFCIRGAKAKLGNGYVFENKYEEVTV